MITVNSFFSGIGGFDLAFEKMGFKVNFQCEVNDFCNSVLSKHWPNTKKFGDIRYLLSNDIPAADIWCAGFPCQDVSVARGSFGRDGLKGRHSGLFYDFLERIKNKRPKIVLIENVTGLLNSHNGNDFKIIVQSLASIGYGVSWRVLNTRFFGTPQSRPRIYICAWLNSPDKAMWVLNEPEASVQQPSQRLGFLKVYQDSLKKISVPELSYCLSATSGRHTGTDWSRTYVSYYDKVRRLTPAEAEKLQGFPPEWTVPLGINTDKKLDIDTLRYHAIGNAVSVPVIVWIADRIQKVMSKNFAFRGLTPLMKKFEDFSQDRIRSQFFSSLNSELLFPQNNPPKIKWRTGGVVFGDEIIDSKVHSSPNEILESLLIDIIDLSDVDLKYFLSASAARGILRRVSSQNRKLFPPLLKSLRRLAGHNQIINTSE